MTLPETFLFWDSISEMQYTSHLVYQVLPAITVLHTHMCISSLYSLYIATSIIYHDLCKSDDLGEFRADYEVKAYCMYNLVKTHDCS